MVYCFIGCVRLVLLFLQTNVFEATANEGNPSGIKASDNPLHIRLVDSKAQIVL